MKNPMSLCDSSDSLYRINCCLCFSFCLGLSSLKVLQVFYLEVLDVGSLTANILFGHTNINVGRLLEELRSL